MNDHANQPNRLIHETSPYLLQHAHNPVDWYAWGEEALTRAKKEDLPILLSIGYSACHWCHVMERESFENEKIAEIMNRNYVCIKVDREERPDLDKVYQSAHQMFNQRGGGWPLTAILTPDELIPIHVGTYYPAQPRQGMPGFGELLTRVAEVYRNQKNSLSEHSRSVKNAFAQLAIAIGQPDTTVNDQLIPRAVEHLINQYDPVFGGFSEAPKFPHPTQIEILLNYWQRAHHTDPNTEKRAIDAAVHTLEAMAQGGMYDQLGGGFCRYSVDAKWEIPHFEKMLYDTAQLMPLYVDAGFLANREDFHQVAIQSGEWVTREMQSPDGGYYSAIDADSEGEEGKFYVWTLDELRQLLSQEELDVITIRFGLRGAPNFEGKWHLRIAHSIDDVAHRAGQDRNQVVQRLAQAQEKMLTIRNQRIAPLCDDKILASWNGLMIKAMAKTGRLLGRNDFVDSAERALNYIQQKMWQNNRLFATARGSKAHLNAYLDDYAFVADAAIELLQARWCDQYIEFVEQLVNVLLKYFEDPNTGAFFFTSNDHEKLLHRSIPTYDDATPSGNGVATQVLLKLSYLTGELRYRDRADRIIKTLQTAAAQYPSAFGSGLTALEEFLNPSPTLVVCAHEMELKQWVTTCVSSGSQKLIVYPVPPDAVRMPKPVPEEQKKSASRPVAYLCEGYTCSIPCYSLSELLTILPPRKLR